LKPVAQQQPPPSSKPPHPDTPACQNITATRRRTPDTPARKNIAATRRRPRQNAPAVTDSGFNPRARLPPAALVVYRNHNI
jgi:hypothetical protein